MNMAAQSNEACIHEHSLASLVFTLQWKNETGVHKAIQYVERFNMWRDMDLLPQVLIDDLINHAVGKGPDHFFNAGELVPAWQSSLQKTLPVTSFTGCLPDGEKIKPKVGRFYPAGMISGINGIYSGNMQPVRIVGIWDDKIVIDLNHPLALEDISVQVEIVSIHPSTIETGGRCTDVIETMLSNGPGMQLAYTRTITDFFADNIFDRIDDNDDSVFYEKERKVHHLDENARKSISELYNSLIESGDRVLDLMSSWESHISTNLTNKSERDGLTDIYLTGLGMNEKELKSNPQLNDYIVHDLNAESAMPYENELFDVVVCTASVEYLTNPINVFVEVHRILKPGGKFIITFSNRWFPAKAIKLWAEIHEFERVGLVSEYFRKSGWQGSIDTLSSRGRHRPEDDPHYHQTQISDPVYAVWCVK